MWSLRTSVLRTSAAQTQALRTPPARTQCRIHLVRCQGGDGRLGSSTPPSQCAAVDRGSANRMLCCTGQQLRACCFSRGSYSHAYDVRGDLDGAATSTDHDSTECATDRQTTRRSTVANTTLALLSLVALTRCPALRPKDLAELTSRLTRSTHSSISILLHRMKEPTQRPSTQLLCVCVCARAETSGTCRASSNAGQGISEMMQANPISAGGYCVFSASSSLSSNVGILTVSRCSLSAVREPSSIVSSTLDATSKAAAIPLPRQDFEFRK